MQEIQIFNDIDIYFHSNSSIYEWFTKFQKENDYDQLFNEMNLEIE